jgi:hypothetical protein
MLDYVMTIPGHYWNSPKEYNSVYIRKWLSNHGFTLSPSAFSISGSTSGIILFHYKLYGIVTNEDCTLIKLALPDCDIAPLHEYSHD